VTSLNDARKLLRRALQKHAVAQSEPEIEAAVLALHTGLEESLRMYLSNRGFEEVGHRGLSFPELVSLLRDQTDLFSGDRSVVRLLVSLNTTRNSIAHPRGDRLSAQQIAQDADQLAQLSRRFWPALFGDAAPTADHTTSPRRPLPLQTTPSHDIPRRSLVARASSTTGRPTLERTTSSYKVGEFLKRLWHDENEPYLNKALLSRRMFGIVLYLMLAKWCREAALFTAPWPEPVKYGSVALFLVSTASFIWVTVIVARALKQVRIKRLLLGASVFYILWFSVALLTSAAGQCLPQTAWAQTRRLTTFCVRNVRNLGETVLAAPGEFRFAYTGRRTPLVPAGLDAKDASYLTPIPASDSTPPSVEPTAEVAPRSSLGPTWVPLSPPDCPYPQANLRAPLVNEVVGDTIQAKGTASIEMFDYYKFEIRSEDAEDDWHWLVSYDTPVENGDLGMLEVSTLPEGAYTLRLIVVDHVGNFPFPPCEVKIRVRH